MNGLSRMRCFARFWSVRIDAKEKYQEFVCLFHLLSVLGTDCSGILGPAYSLTCGGIDAICKIGSVFQSLFVKVAK